MNTGNWKDRLSREREALSARPARVGGYSVALGGLLLAILVALNVLVEALPSKWTQWDISSARLYSLTSNTKVVLTNLEEDVTIYWISQAKEEDTVIGKLLERYGDTTRRITVEKRDPDVYPTFAQQYTSSTVQNNSLVVTCGDKSRYIPYSDIYQYSGSYYGSDTADFDGEGAITSAIDYVTRDTFPQIYQLTGHGEGELPESLLKQLDRDNMELQTLSLLTVDEIPEDCAAVILYTPERDLSEEETAMLRSYVAEGGCLLVLSGPQGERELSNLHSLLAVYGVTFQDGIVVEGDRDYYAFQSPLVLRPEVESHAITDPLRESGYHAIVPVGQGLVLGEEKGAQVTALLMTSGQAYSKLAGYAMDTTERENGDVDGPYALGVAVEEDSGGKLVWLASDDLLQEPYQSYSSGGNLDLTMNSLSWMAGQSEVLAIRSKSLDHSYLTISDGAAAWLKLCMVGILPVGVLLFGVDEARRRRKLV